MDNFYRDLQGEPEQGCLDISATQQYPLGTRFAKNDGRVFRYAQAGAVALIAGDLIQSAILSGAVTTPQADMTPVAAAAGAYKVSVTSKATIQPKNTFADGWLAITDGDAAAAMGDLYLIKSHPASAASTAGWIFTLHEPLKRALTTASRVSVLKNIYADVIQAPVTTATGVAVGICPTVVTAEYYFWLQTWGMSNVLVKTALVAGQNVQRDVIAAGSVGKAAVTLWAENIGMSGWVTATTNSGFVFLTIAP